MSGPVPLVIVGAGGHGREILDVVEAMNAAAPGSWRPVGFVADDADARLVAARGLEVVGSSHDLGRVLAEHSCRYHLGIGSGAVRRRLDESLDDRGRAAAVTLVHPSATIGSTNRIGPGVLLAAGARITTNVEVGRHTHLNVGAVVSHDGVIGDYVTLSPGVLVNGAVEIGAGAFLGTGAIVLPGRHVGAGAVIGAGAVVASDVPPGVTASGVPARW